MNMFLESACCQDRMIASWIVTLCCTWFQKDIYRERHSRQLHNSWNFGSKSLWIFPILLAGWAM